MKKAKRGAIPPLEWAAAGFGLLVVAGLILVILRGAIGPKDEVPLLSAGIERIVATPDGHVVEVTVVNRHNVTAAAVRIEGAVGSETSVATIDYVPGHSSGRSGLIFTGDPRSSGLKVRVTGYELP